MGLAAVRRLAIKLQKSTPLAAKEELITALGPSRPALHEIIDPRVVMFGENRLGRGSLQIQRKNPAVFIVGRLRHHYRSSPLLIEERFFKLHIPIRDARVNRFHLSGHGVDHHYLGRGLEVAHVGAPGDVFGVCRLQL